MKHRCVFVALSFALLSAVAAPPAAAADACQWRVQDLPLPAEVKHGWIYGNSENNTFVVGQHWTDAGGRGVVWENGVLRPMTPPSRAVDTVTPDDVNNSGVVVGSYYESRGADSRYRAFRYQNGAYEFLATERNEESMALGVNESGDVIGEVWLRSDSSKRQVALWPKGQPRRLYFHRYALGISNDRKLVAGSLSDAWLIDGGTGRWTEVPDGDSGILFDNERLLYSVQAGATRRIVERDLEGVEVASYEGGTSVVGRNSGGTLLGVSDAGRLSLWENGVRGDLNTDKQPEPGRFGDITDDGVLIGTYSDVMGNLFPARWLRTCA